MQQTSVLASAAPELCKSDKCSQQRSSRTTAVQPQLAATVSFTRPHLGHCFAPCSICEATLAICACLKIGCLSEAFALQVLSSFHLQNLVCARVQVCVCVCVLQISIIYKMPAGTFPFAFGHISMQVAADSKVQQFRSANNASPRIVVNFW